MMEFKSSGREKQFQDFFAEQHLTWDLYVYSTGLLLSFPVMFSCWRHSNVRSPLWHVSFLTVFIVGKVIPTSMITKHTGFYTRHRTAFALATRVLEICITCTYLPFWADYSNKGDFREWMVLASVIANNTLSTIFWSLLQPIPNRWWMLIQTVDLGRLFLTNTTSMRQLEGGFHHLAPLAGALNALLAKISMPSIRETELLFYFWIVLEVLAGFMLPSLLTYRLQRRSRRQWRQGLAKRGPERGAQREIGGSGLPDQGKDPGLDIRPTWALFLPESVAFLALCFVAGQDPRLLQYMV